MVDLIDPDTDQWNCSLLWSFFTLEHAVDISKIHLSLRYRRDQLIWTLEKSGQFTVKSMFREVVRYRSVPIAPVGVVCWRKLWKLKMHERLKICLWKLTWDAIPTKGKIAERMGSREGEYMLCVLCGEEVETTHHLMMGCIMGRIL